MNYSDSIKIYSDAPSADFAAELFCNEVNNRIADFASISDNKDDSDFIFKFDKDIKKDSYRFKLVNKTKITVYASGKRGFIYAVGMILRKMNSKDTGFFLTGSFNRTYSPYKRIRGHQLGYRTTPNTYDAWDYDQYYRYCLDLMYFGMNTVEHIPYQKGYSERNPLMKYDEEEFLVKASEMADELDLDVSLWHPNYDNETHESAAKRRGELYSKLKRLDYVFIPGGDPGDLPADVFIERCKAISRELKKVHPDAQMWPSVQAPHEIENWGDEFIRKLKEYPEEIDGVIYGPNHAFPLKELRKKVPKKYPLRFYPDITHNVRCEYPVHTGFGFYGHDDWHFALAACLSRECANPRPEEYSCLYNDTRKYVIGSVSYSEGITDDVNKAVWSALDYHTGSRADSAKWQVAVDDYCRLFFFGVDYSIIQNIIISLEYSWYGAPEYNKNIDFAYDESHRLLKENPFLNDNWRYLQILLRSDCDKYVRERRIFDLNLIESAKELLASGNKDKAKEILLTDYPDEIIKIREEITLLCDKMFKLIGYQSDVEHYYANGWERGAILNTIDNPVTDRQWLLSKWDEPYLMECFEHNNVGEGGFVYSVALNGVNERQQGEPYHNFRGDNPNENNGTLPTSLFDVFDNYTFNITADGLEDNCDYVMRVTYLNKRDDDVTNLKIVANGVIVYNGPQFGDIDNEYCEKFCTHKYVTAKYSFPKECINGGQSHINFSEPLMGVMFSEIRITEE